MELDQADINFLEDLAEELRRINPVYNAEAEELENIISKKMANKNWQRIWFICSECGEKTWTEVDLETYVFSTDDLICDDCNPVEEAT